ncbi:microtubule-associated protein Jupiter isoform X4 [Bombus vosnesenskii]|uniref:Microtubule-associated protein Jupiter n=2 Tax=Pyrobombus TaxID=144703 RepID=A0A6J3K2Y6_9HYME|nr:microtubule-associated protein Jupiter isoform X4 [Bombus impatiens]XP_033346861.1 microtubule-associated protein Jupiter isoform X4 [Bombus vosnesenskii]XP_043579708.1 microtubule-associated protein Jupiter isoform X4 [Bombus pyrosoma]XP_050477714.1 microtubule-associated protein Jupiter isoform X4 [Bombus huntii]
MATYATYRHVELDNVGYGKKRVLKPPGGGSSDIFGAAPEETSPRRVKNHNQSQLGSALFGDTPNSNSNETPRNKPGNDSYNRLFGPPDAPPTTPNAKNHMRSNISLSGESTSSSVSSGAATSPAKSTGSTDSIAGVLNGYAASNGNNLTNDVTGGSSCLTRNPVTGDGVDVTPVRRSARRCRDGNPVTGTGYAESQNNGPAVQNGTSSSNSSEKSNDTSPAAKVPARTRVPPGGYSSGLW